MISLSLPMPPSVNSLWRSRRIGNKVSVYPSPRYATWKRVADNALLAKGKRRPKGVKGNFEAVVTLNDAKRRGDADNRMKALMDWLQRSGLIENDSLADKITVGWGPTNGAGCIVTLSPSLRSIERRAA
jgi:Holliday junction resolvase RusA-like endonuclease